MSKTTETYINPHLLYIFFALAIIGILVSVYAIIGVQNNSNNINDIEISDDKITKEEQKWIKAWVAWYLFNNYTKTIIDPIQKDVTELRDDVKLNKGQIVGIKNDIKNKFPQASEVEEEEQTAISETPFLTLTMEKSEWTLGATIVFTGTATPHDLVSITVKLPDRTLLYGQVVPADIINGSYRIEIETEFDQPAGFWTVFAKQGKEQSTTLTFKVE